MKTNIWNLLFDRLIRFIQSDYPECHQIQKTVKKGKKKKNRAGVWVAPLPVRIRFFNRTIFVTAETRDHQRWNIFSIRYSGRLCVV